MSDINRQGLVTKSLLLQVIFLQNSDYKGFKLKGFRPPASATRLKEGIQLNLHSRSQSTVYQLITVLFRIFLFQDEGHPASVGSHILVNFCYKLFYLLIFSFKTEIVAVCRVIRAGSARAVAVCTESAPGVLLFKLTIFFRKETFWRKNFLIATLNSQKINNYFCILFFGKKTHGHK